MLFCKNTKEKEKSSSFMAIQDLIPLSTIFIYKIMTEKGES